MRVAGRAMVGAHAIVTAAVAIPTAVMIIVVFILVLRSFRRAEALNRVI